MVSSKLSKRKPGEKAGLNPADIVAQSLALLETNSVLTITGIADALGVYPTAVKSYFPGGIAEIETEMVRSALSNVARPFQPKECWEAYLRDLFRAVFNTFHRRPELAQVAVNRIAANYYLNSLLVERILFALSVAGVPDAKKVNALDLVMGSLISMVAVEYSGLKCTSAAKWLSSLSDAVSAPSIGEYPQINALRDKLILQIKHRRLLARLKKPTPVKAERFADYLIAGLKAQILA